MGETTKTCSKCQITKPLSEFRKAKGYRDGYDTQCNSCKKEWRKGYEAQHRDRESSRKLKDNYGITLEEYNRMLEAQGGVCAVCGKPPNGKRLCVDHSHNTGAVRGLLCNACNTALGQVDDNVSLLQKLIGYLTR